MPPLEVTLTYAAHTYSFTEKDQSTLKGRLSCDCFRSELIQAYCDPDFPVLHCGTLIEVGFDSSAAGN